jgi:HEAT repeat protein
MWRLRARFTKRLVFVLAALPALGIVVVLSVPPWSAAFRGWLRGEPFYDGRPTSFWLNGLKKQDIEERRKATAALAQIGKPAVPGLIDALHDPDLQVRVAAGNALAQMGADARDAVPALMGAAATKATPALGRALRDKDAQVRKDALAALCAMGPDAWPVLLEALHSAQVPDREKIPAALVQSGLGGEPTVRALSQAIGDKGIRVAAIGAIAALGWSARDAVPALVKALAVNDPETQRAATFALARMGPAPRIAVPDLAQLPDRERRLDAILGLAYVWPRDRRSTSGLCKALKDSDVAVRRAATEAVAGVEPAHALPALIAVLHDADTEVRLRAVRSLGYYREWAKPATAPLCRVVQQDPDINVRRGAIWALIMIGPERKEIRPVLITAMRDKELSDHVFSNLPLTGKAAVPVLVEALRDENIRLEAMRVLGWMGPTAEAAGAVLAQLTEDEDPEVWAAAEEALNRIGTGPKVSPQPPEQRPAAGAKAKTKN